MKNEEYESQILQWRTEKYDGLIRENGWLALAGLHWLKEGRNLIGSNPLCEVNLPEHAPTFLGVVEKKGKVVRFQVAQGVRAEVNDKLVDKTVLKSTKDSKPSFITWHQPEMVSDQQAVSLQRSFQSVSPTYPIRSTRYVWRYCRRPHGWYPQF